jgi:hypothetical protein
MLQKNNGGTMAFDVIIKDDDISIINIDHHEERNFLLPESAYQNRRGRRRYLGPNYLALDIVSFIYDTYLLVNGRID